MTEQNTEIQAQSHIVDPYDVVRKVQDIFAMYGYQNDLTLEDLTYHLVYHLQRNPQKEVEFVEERASSSLYEYWLGIKIGGRIIELGIWGEGHGRAGEKLYSLFWSLYSVLKSAGVKVRYVYSPGPWLEYQSEYP